MAVDHAMFKNINGESELSSDAFAPYTTIHGGRRTKSAKQNIIVWNIMYLFFFRPYVYF